MQDRVLVALLTAVALALRLGAASRLAYWDDDLGTIFETHRIDSIAALLTASPISGHPPLSFLVAKAWLALTGGARPGGELLARVPFVFAGALSVPLSWLVARKLVDRGPALLVACGTAASPLLVWCDRDIRGYALLVPLALATVLAWLHAQEKPRAWGAFVVLGALACWDHYNALPLVAGLLGLAVIERLVDARRTGASRAALAAALRAPVLAGAGLALLYAAWVPQLVTHLRGINLDAHTATVQLHVEPVVVTAPAYVLYGLVLGYSVFPWNALVVVPVAVAAFVLALSGLRRLRLVAFLALPVIGAAFTTFKMPRYHVHYVPLVLVVLAAGARGRVRTALAAIVLAGMLFSDVHIFSGRELHFLYAAHPWREVAAKIRERPAPVVAVPDRPFSALYVPDLIAPVASSSSAWLVLEARDGEDERGALERAGFRVVSDEAVLVDPDFEERARFVGRGARREVVRLLRFERP